MRIMMSMGVNNFYPQRLIVLVFIYKFVNNMKCFVIGSEKLCLLCN